MLFHSLCGQASAGVPHRLCGSRWRAMRKRKAESTVVSFAGSGVCHGFSWHSADPKVLAEGRLSPETSKHASLFGIGSRVFRCCDVGSIVSGGLHMGVAVCVLCVCVCVLRRVLCVVWCVLCLVCCVLHCVSFGVVCCVLCVLRCVWCVVCCVLCSLRSQLQLVSTKRAWAVDFAGMRDVPNGVFLPWKSKRHYTAGYDW